MDSTVKPSGKLWTEHIEGKTAVRKRNQILHNLATLPRGTRGVVSNCACLNEGVDVPVLDGIAFVDPRRSEVDIIQAVGRVIRKAENKKIGTVVIPVYVDESEDAEQVLSSSAFEPVWRVVRALRAHDDRLAIELDGLRTKLGQQVSGRGRIKLPERTRFDLPSEASLKDF